MPTHMLPLPGLHSMRRILDALKTYRQQTADQQDPICNKKVNEYLKKQLTIEDWIFWQRIQVEEYMHHQYSGPKRRSCPRQIKRLMGQYKSPGQALIQLWRKKMHIQPERVNS